ncbi:MFS transporter [Rhizorhabdus dicambivorans]|uniref:MFS transporter n=2 Tax=Rhizorhabdus dicambivorans TaxID=1850238 RepID=A0A2A4FQY8_9SPHN|nr:MFS transporter [Rhizorhabdus dicambivorans]PCE40140.1 MFS transporter [Rhizorhabdus dicambivorans]
MTIMSESDHDQRPGPYAWYVAGVTMLAYVISMIDRKFPFILVESIKRDLHLSDTQVGLLTGVVFTIVYATMAVPTARLADRSSRKRILIASLTVWSCLTSLGGFAQNFWQLAASRVGVAIGESGCSPAAHSMIADYFPPKYRARALGLYFMGAYLGALIGLAAAGWINDLANWRVAMWVLGAPGLLLAVLIIFTVREPERRSLAKAELEVRPSVSQTIFAILRDRTLLLLLIGCALFSFMFGGLQAFAPAYIMRTFHVGTTEVGLSYGLCVGLSGALGSILGGFAGDRYGDQRWKALMVVGLALFAGPPAFWFALATQSYALFLLAFFVAHLGMMLYAGPTYSYMQSRLDSRMHAIGSAIFLFAVSGLGVAFGPLAVGMLSDHFAAIMSGAEPLRHALRMLLAPGLVAACIYVAAALLIRGTERWS